MYNYDPSKPNKLRDWWINNCGGVIFLCFFIPFLSFAVWFSVFNNNFWCVTHRKMNPPEGYKIAYNGYLYTYLKPGENLSDNYRTYKEKYRAIRMSWADYETEVENSKKENPDWKTISK